MNRLFSSFLVLGFTLVGWSQPTKDSFKEASYSQDGKSLNYRILYPENFNKNKQYPVVLFLHGAGERGSDNKKQLAHGSSLFLSDSFRETYPAVVIFPQCPKESYWANVDVDRSSFPLTFNFKNGGEPTYAMKLVMGLMDSVKSLSYSQDDRLYLGGLSMGGFGTYELLSRKPNMFAAAFAICGGAHPATASNYASFVPMWVFHGGKDNVVLPSYSTEMVIALRKAGGSVKYTLYKDANHNSWDSAFAEPGLMDWLFSHKNSN